MTTTLTDRFEVVCDDTARLGRDEWLQLRKLGIGSSDAAPAMGLSPWTSTYALYCDKANLVPEQEQSRMFAWRLALEPVILGDWITQQGGTGPIQRHLMLRSTEFPFMLANPDGLTRSAVIEVKTAHSMDERRWDAGVPDHYVIQAMHLMAVTGRRECIFPVMFGCDPPRTFIVEWDPEVAGPMIEAESIFWKRVLDRQSPDPDGSDASMHALRSRYLESIEGKSVDLPEELRFPLTARNLYLAEANTATAQADVVKARLMEFMGDAEVCRLDGDVVATWRPNKNGTRVFRFSTPKGDS